MTYRSHELQFLYSGWVINSSSAEFKRRTETNNAELTRLVWTSGHVDSLHSNSKPGKISWIRHSSWKIRPGSQTIENGPSLNCSIGQKCDLIFSLLHITSVAYRNAPIWKLMGETDQNKYLAEVWIPNTFFGL